MPAKPWRPPVFEHSHEKAMNKKPDKNDPLVRLGQGDYVRNLTPADFDETPRDNEGACMGLMLIALFYFGLGLLLGAWFR